MATGYVKGAFESTPGNESNTPTLSTKVLYAPVMSFEINPGVEHLARDDENRNLDEAVAVLPESFNATWSMSVRAYPDVLGFLLKGIFGAPVTTAGNGVITDPGATVIPVGAYRHVFTSPFGPAGANPMTTEWIVAYKDQSVFYRLKGCGINQFSIENQAQGGVMLNVSGPCLYFARITDPALTATYESLATHPFKSSNMTIPTWLTGSANCEKTGMSWQWENPMTPYTSCQTASKYPDQLEKGDAPITLTGSAPKHLLDLDDWDALIAGTGFATKTQWVSDTVIASGYQHKLFIETANSQYVSGQPDALSNQRNHGATFQWKATNASGSAGSQTITVVNATASYV